MRAPQRRWFATTVAFRIALLGFLLMLVSGPVATAQQDQTDDAVFIWQVTVDDTAAVDALVNGGYDLVESRGPDYLLVVGTQAVADQLERDGFRVRVDRELTRDGGGVLTYFGGYRTVTEHIGHLNEVEAAYPELATVFDYGDSWRKVQGRTDNDLLAICLTNKQPGDCALNPNSAKPRAVIMSSIHARELQTAEIAWRLIDDLTQKYGVDADITHIMDSTEVWIIPIANPDGRQIVESGGNNPYMQRKNGNDSVGDCALPATSFNHHGVDLNRNATWGWGGEGTTLDPCAQTYRGTGPASEPEQSALEQLFRQLWPDQKGPNWNDPVSGDATGSFITIHSFGDLILLPSGQADSDAPNDTELRAFAFRMAHWNQYVVGTAPEILYGASGTTDDHVYYELGVPGFTYELSPREGLCSGFAPPYGCVDAEIWPRNRDALLYSMKVAGAPYTEPLGPTTLTVTVPSSVTVGDPIMLTAEASDDAFGSAAGSIGRPTTSAVNQVAYWIDTPPADPGDGSGTALTPSDGAWDETNEQAEVVLGQALEPGDHTVFVRARNALGYWGPVTAASFNVEAAAVPDVNLDGTADADDVMAILNQQVGNASAAFSASAADVNTDGRISILDALELARLLNQPQP